MKRNLTDWFDGSLHSPSRIGWYNAVLKGYFHTLDEEQKSITRRYWNGSAWGHAVYVGEVTVDNAMFLALWPSYYVFWRGCTEEQFQ